MRQTKRAMLYSDFKEAVILLVQHPVMLKPFCSLSDGEKESAYDLLSSLADLSVCENYTLVDYLQLSRLNFMLGRLAQEICLEPEKVIGYYNDGYECLQKSGIDLSLNKWSELVSLRMAE